MASILSRPQCVNDSPQNQWQTKQNSMQSVGNMTALHTDTVFPHFVAKTYGALHSWEIVMLWLWLSLPIIVKMIVENTIRKINSPWPKSDPFLRWSGHISMPKTTDCDQNLTSSDDDQNTSAYHISGHAFHACFQKTPGNLLGRRTDGRYVPIRLHQEKFKIHIFSNEKGSWIKKSCGRKNKQTRWSDPTAFWLHVYGHKYILYIFWKHPKIVSRLFFSWNPL